VFWNFRFLWDIGIVILSAAKDLFGFTGDASLRSA
jgi:hypothetical protein